MAMKLDSSETNDLIGKPLSSKPKIDRGFIMGEVNRLVRAVAEGFRNLELPDTPVEIRVPEPKVTVQRPEPPPRKWRFEIERDGAGRIKAVNAVGED